MLPSILTITASPGLMSLSGVKPSVVQATLSEAMIISVKSSNSFLPINRGLIPLGSRKAISPHPVINAVTL